MTTDIPHLSDGFQRLYCDATVFASLSGFHPISFARVLPFQSQDLLMDDRRLIDAEEAHLADRSGSGQCEIRHWLLWRGFLRADGTGLRERRHVYLRSSVVSRIDPGTG